MDAACPSCVDHLNVNPVRPFGLVLQEHESGEAGDRLQAEEQHKRPALSNRVGRVANPSCRAALALVQSEKAR